MGSDEALVYLVSAPAVQEVVLQLQYTFHQLLVTRVLGQLQRKLRGVEDMDAFASASMQGPRSLLLDVDYETAARLQQQAKQQQQFARQQQLQQQQHQQGLAPPYGNSSNGNGSSAGQQVFRDNANSNNAGTMFAQGSSAAASLSSLGLFLPPQLSSPPSSNSQQQQQRQRQGSGAQTPPGQGTQNPNTSAGFPSNPNASQGFLSSPGTPARVCAPTGHYPAPHSPSPPSSTLLSDIYQLQRYGLDGSAALAGLDGGNGLGCLGGLDLASLGLHLQGCDTLSAGVDKGGGEVVFTPQGRGGGGGNPALGSSSLQQQQQQQQQLGVLSAALTAHNGNSGNSNNQGQGQGQSGSNNNQGQANTAALQQQQQLRQQQQQQGGGSGGPPSAPHSNSLARMSDTGSLCSTTSHASYGEALHSLVSSHDPIFLPDLGSLSQSLQQQQQQQMDGGLFGSSSAADALSSVLSLSMGVGSGVGSCGQLLAPMSASLSGGGSLFGSTPSLSPGSAPPSHSVSPSQTFSLSLPLDHTSCGYGMHKGTSSPQLSTAAALSAAVAQLGMMDPADLDALDPNSDPSMGDDGGLDGCGGRGGLGRPPPAPRSNKSGKGGAGCNGSMSCAQQGGGGGGSRSVEVPGRFKVLPPPVQAKVLGIITANPVVSVRRPQGGGEGGGRGH